MWMLVNRDEGERQSRLGYCAARRMSHECDRVESNAFYLPPNHLTTCTAKATLFLLEDVLIPRDVR